MNSFFPIPKSEFELRRLSRPGSYVVQGCPEPNVPCTVMVQGVVLGLFMVLFGPALRNFLPTKVITSAGSVGGPEFPYRLLECSGNGSLDPAGFPFFMDHKRNPCLGNPVFAGDVTVGDAVENHLGFNFSIHLVLS